MFDSVHYSTPVTQTAFQPMQAPEALRGGAAQSSYRGDSIKHDYFAFGTILQDPKTKAVLVIDTRPPKEVRDRGVNRLAYYFRNGIPSPGYEQHALPEAVNKIREDIRLEVLKYGDGDCRHHPKGYYPDEWKKILKSSSRPANSLLAHYEFTETAARRQGWQGKWVANPTEHHLGRLRDYDLGYLHALADSPRKRAWGAIVSRPKLYMQGFFQTLNRAREQGQKGGRTIFTSLPATVFVGSNVAMLAVLMSQKGATKPR